jgi:formylglycine-generating enzyme required for sulfatase activity
MRGSACARVVVVLAIVAGAMVVVAGADQGRPPDGQRYHEAIAGTVVTFEMTMVPAGPALVPADEGATRPVAVDAFYIGRTEVTWDLYDVYALGLDTPPARGAADAIARPSNPYGAPDYGWGHAGFPAMSVTRHAAETFCQWLSAKTGRKYRLPTEAEWLRAAQLAAGGTVLAADRRDAVAWHRGNSEGRTHAVGTRMPDALGLFDLFGNVAEWVVPADGALVARGGSFRDGPDRVGPPVRAVQDPSWNETDPQLPKSRWWLSDSPFAGFRIVRTP